MGLPLITGCTLSRMSEQTESANIEQKSEPTDNEESTENPGNGSADESSGGSDEKATQGDIKQLYGTWFIWIPGGAVNLYDEDSGNYVTHEYNEGADAGKVVINKDGAYSMRHSVWGKDEVVKGKWRLSSPDEINGEQVQAIVLKNGIGDIDWAVAPSPNGKIRLLYAEKWDDESTLWILDSELYKK